MNKIRKSQKENKKLLAYTKWACKCTKNRAEISAMIQEFGDSTQVRPDVQTLIAFIVTLQLRVTVGSIRNS